uniref:BZIP domain-containing protein n=1 Tax=Chlamydomonas euryale TaxID=1486919 RepID=A0A7R9V808_9CHLO|mmetsp:Transcript_2136/g.5632  ORF Transcript_2136/g.5632 Transcript_2136/m.5632 type:complete len:183 (+) Transcript_2136:666-1214(+)
MGTASAEPSVIGGAACGAGCSMCGAEHMGDGAEGRIQQRKLANCGSARRSRLRREAEIQQELQEELLQEDANAWLGTYMRELEQAAAALSAANECFAVCLSRWAGRGGLSGGGVSGGVTSELARSAADAACAMDVATTLASYFSLSTSHLQTQRIAEAAADAEQNSATRRSAHDDGCGGDGG